MSTNHILFQKPLIGKATCNLCGRDFEIALHSEAELYAWLASPYTCEECRAKPTPLSQIAPDPVFIANWLSLDPDDLPDLDDDEDFDDLLDDLEPYDPRNRYSDLRSFDAQWTPADLDNAALDIYGFPIYDADADAEWHPEIAVTPDNPHRQAWRDAFDALTPDQRRYCYADCPLSPIPF